VCFALLEDLDGTRGFLAADGLGDLGGGPTDDVLRMIRRSFRRLFLRQGIGNISVCIDFDPAVLGRDIDGKLTEGWTNFALKDGNMI
jgi:hypothetical protein